VAEVTPLAEKGLIAGIYISRHNIADRTMEAVKSEIAALQSKRRLVGLPPLIVSVDQEGGIVSHLSPPLTALPALATLADFPPDVREERAEQFGRTHGQELSAIGINLNFAPVLDLRPPAHNHVCTAVVEALNAGVDLLLIAFDGSQFYRSFACASDAFNRHDLDVAALHDSEARLEQTFGTAEANPTVSAMSRIASDHGAGGINPVKSGSPDYP
jgi:hypothetical protein